MKKFIFLLIFISSYSYAEMIEVFTTYAVSKNSSSEIYNTHVNLGLFPYQETYINCLFGKVILNTYSYTEMRDKDSVGWHSSQSKTSTTTVLPERTCRKIIPPKPVKKPQLVPDQKPIVPGGKR